MLKRSLFALLILGSAWNSYGAVNPAQTPPPSKSTSGGFSLVMTGSLRTDGFFGNNQQKDTFYFEQFDHTYPLDDIAKRDENPDAPLTAGAQRVAMKKANSMFAVNNSRLQIEATNKKEDWMYSMVLILTGDLSSSQSVREAYIELTHKSLGTLLLGNTGGLEARVACGPSDFIPGTGGTDGNFSRMLNVTTYTEPFPKLMNDTGKATKAMYVTPFLGGFRLYAAYTPNTKQIGERKLDTAFSPERAAFGTFDLKSFSYGIDYNLKSGMFSLNLAFVGITSQTHGELPNRYVLQRHNSKCYDIGAVVGIGPVTFGAEYFINGKSATLKHGINVIEPTIEGEKLPSRSYDPDLAGGYKSLNLGIAIQDGASTFGVSYFKTSRRTGLKKAGSNTSSVAKATALVFSFEQKLAPGLAAYVETGLYKMTNPDWAYVATVYSGCTKFPTFATPSNKATITLAGIKIQF